MKPRIIGVKTCSKCRHLKKSFEKQGVDFEYLDGDRDDIQDDLDKMNINDFPVVQIIDDNGSVIYQWDRALYPSGVSYGTVKRKMEKMEKKSD